MMKCLSRQERIIVLLCAEGLSRRDISEKLAISEMTTQRHLANINEKLGTKSRIQVVTMYYKQYWEPKTVARKDTLYGEHQCNDQHAGQRAIQPGEAVRGQYVLRGGDGEPGNAADAREQAAIRRYPS